MQKFVVLAERAAVYPTGRGASIFPTLFAGYRPLGCERSGLAKTRVRVTPRVRGEGKGKGENCCGNSNFDFHPKFPPPQKKVFFFLLYISLNFTIHTSWTCRGLNTIHLPFLRESVRCTARLQM